MQLVPLGKFTPFKTVNPSRRRSGGNFSEGRARLGNAADFEPLSRQAVNAFEDFIEGEFEDLGEGAANPTAKSQSYLNVLFPQFLLKSRYVNYYV